MWQWNIPTFDLYLICTISIEMYCTCLITSFLCQKLMHIYLHCRCCTWTWRRRKKEEAKLLCSWSSVWQFCQENLLYQLWWVPIVPSPPRGCSRSKKCQWGYPYLAKIKLNPWLIFISSLPLAFDHRYILSFVSAGMWNKSQKNWMLSWALLSLTRLSSLNN